MLCFIDKNTDPYINLATEEYLLKEYSEPIFRLWRNSPSVIVGRNQNTIAEINTDFIRKNSIPVVRRLTGGGAVFHDLGNINFTFIDRKIEGEDTSDMFARFTAPILEALRRIGVEASLQGRNDLVIDGRKFSGNAICVHRDRILQHGTLLFSSSIGDLSGALNTRPEKFIGKSVKSNISRVTNISDHLPQSLKESMSPEGFMDYISGFIMSMGKSYSISLYSKKDLSAISELSANKYSKDEWNYGCSPKFTFTNSMKLPAGFIEVFLNIDKGVISECNIRGDYFFTASTSDLEKTLTGIPYRYDDVYSVLKKIQLNEYISGINIDSLMGIIIPA